MGAIDAFSLVLRANDDMDQGKALPCCHRDKDHLCCRDVTKAAQYGLRATLYETLCQGGGFTRIGKPMNEKQEFKMKKFFAVSALAVAASAAVPAMAQDANVPFDGPYVAAMAGWDKVRIDTPIGGGSDDGILFGGVVGFDKNIKGVVLGVEGEYADSNVKESADNVFVVGDRASLKTGRDLYAGVRLGGELVPGFLVYAKGGYTNAKVTASYDDGAVIVSGSDKLDGYRLGAGVETNVSGFLARVEYRYSDYGHYEGTGIQPDRHQVAAMLGYRF